MSEQFALRLGLRSFCLLLLCSLSLPLYALSFEAIGPGKPVYVNQAFELRFQLSSTEGHDRIIDLKLPKMPNFEVLGPSTTVSYSNINGRTSVSEIYIYKLIPLKAGNFQLASAEVLLASGKKMRSQPLRIEVEAVKEQTSINAPAGSLGDQAFIVLELSNPRPVVGEQVFLDLRLYWRVSIRHYQIVREPSFKDMFSKGLDQYEDQSKETRINGQRYYTQVLRRIALFPTRPGRIDIEGASVYLGISADVPGFGGSYHIEPHTLYTKPISMQVSSLDGAPADFKGAVGNYSMSVFADNLLNSDQVLKLRVRITGAGDIRQINTPKLYLDEREWEVFPPEVREVLQEMPGFLGGAKEFEFILSPKKTGQLKINSVFVFFEPRAKRFERLDSLFTVEVRQGQNPLPSNTEPDDLAERQNAENGEKREPLEFLPPQKQTVLSAQGRSSLWQSPYYYLFLGLIPLAYGLAWAYRRRQDSLAEQRQAAAKEAAAKAKVRQQLAEAQELLNKGHFDLFYGELSFGLQDYLAHRLHLPRALWSRQAWQNRLALLPELPPKLAQDWDNLLAHCERALFAGGADSTEDMARLYAQAADLLEQFETFLELGRESSTRQKSG